MYLAEVGLTSGEQPVAEREARLALELSNDIPPLKCLTLAVLARILFAPVAGQKERGEGASRREEAWDVARQAMTMLEAFDAMEGDAYVRLTHAEALEARGDRAGAAAAMRLARDRVLDRAKSIPDPALRESFLTRVWEHTRTLELADAWNR